MTAALLGVLGAGSLGVVAICYRETLAYWRERDVRRFEQRTELLRLKAASAKVDDVEQLKQRVGRLELARGVSR